MLRSRDWSWRTPQADPSPLSCGELVIQAALSVGDPVKNRETSELKEFVALMSMMMSTTPPTSRARETNYFINSATL
jgi:hypothetical protein